MDSRYNSFRNKTVKKYIYHPYLVWFVFCGKQVLDVAWINSWCRQVVIYKCQWHWYMEKKTTYRVLFLQWMQVFSSWQIIVTSKMLSSFSSPKKSKFDTSMIFWDTLTNQMLCRDQTLLCFTHMDLFLETHSFFLITLNQRQESYFSHCCENYKNMSCSTFNDFIDFLLMHVKWQFGWFTSSVLLSWYWTLLLFQGCILVQPLQLLPHNLNMAKSCFQSNFQ